MIRFFSLFTLCAALTACGGADQPKDDGHGAHAHSAKHGGELAELGDHEGFLESKLNHDAGTLHIWIYKGEAMTAAKPDSAPVLNLKGKDGPVKLTATDAGDGSWLFTSEILKGEPEAARFRIAMGGKTYTPGLAHKH
ncbi:MAG: hypothetical protein OER88_12025 [Planctomycetota bacterium]|nr:hypothetical protein [Planctomycetota bacterium]